MFADHASNGFETGPQPDAMPTGEQRVALRQRSLSFQTALDQATPDEQLSNRASRPEIPKKGKHLEEIYRVKQQLSDLQSEHNHLQDSFEWIVLDMDEAEQKLVAQTKQLEEKEAELTAMRKNVASLLAQLDQETQNRVSAEERLQEQEKATPSHMQQNIESLLEAVEQKSVENGDVSRLQAEVIQLTSVVAAQDEKLQEREATAAQTEQRLTSQLQAQTALLEEQRKLREGVEAALAVQQQQAEACLEMAELRRLCNFYQENSQRLSKQIKLVTATGARN